MKDLLALTRALNIYYHFLHNVVTGSTFASDHDLLGDFYTELELDYDSLAERKVVTEGELNVADLMYTLKQTTQLLEAMPTQYDLESHLGDLISLEESLRDELEDVMENSSEATKNLLAGIADRSEVRQYKLTQRSGK